MKERYLITISDTGEEGQIRISVIDQKPVKLVHDSIYTKDLLDVVKNLFLDHYGRNEVRFIETTKESPPKAKASQ